MRLPVIAACIFSAVIGTAYSLQCIQYHPPNAGAYHEDHPSMVENCTSDQDVCLMTFYTLEKRSYIKESGVKFQRRCAKSSQCNMRESLTTAGYKISYSTTCCNTSSCLPLLPVLPERNGHNNGITCPACHTEKTGPCVPERAMACTGNETQCALVTEIMVNEDKVYSRGCGTKNVFRDNGEIISSLSFFSKVTITEANGTHSLGLGNFIWCHVCHDEHYYKCAKLQVLCPVDSDVCLSENRRTVHKTSRITTTQVLRRCAKSTECKFDGSATNAEKTISIKSSCCHTDMCNTTEVTEATWPIKRGKINGKICPLCSHSNVSYCRQSDVIRCTDDETYCIQYAMSITKEGYTEFDVLHGCSSVGICNNSTFKKYETASEKLVMTNDIICSGGIRTSNHLFSLVAALSLLKL